MFRAWLQVMNKGVLSVIIAYVLLKQGCIGFLGSPVSPFASPFSSPFHVLVTSILNYRLSSSNHLHKGEKLTKGVKM